VNSNLSERLQEGDPLAKEPAIPADHVEEMRRAVMVSRRAAPPATAHLGRALIVAAVALAAVVVAFVGSIGRPAQDRGTPAPDAPSEQRQIQFETPGGTRIIWLLNPNAPF
jgi:hypothetical protein